MLSCLVGLGGVGVGWRMAAARVLELFCSDPGHTYQAGIARYAILRWHLNADGKGRPAVLKGHASML